MNGTDLSEGELRDRLDGLRGRFEDDYRELEVRSRSVGLEPERAELFRQFTERLEERIRAGEEGEASVVEDEVGPLQLLVHTDRVQ